MAARAANMALYYGLTQGAAVVRGDFCAAWRSSLLHIDGVGHGGAEGLGGRSGQHGAESAAGHLPTRSRNYPPAVAKQQQPPAAAVATAVAHSMFR